MSGGDRAWVAHWGCMATGAASDRELGLGFFIAAVFFLALVFAGDYSEKKGLK